MMRSRFCLCLLIALLVCCCFVGLFGWCLSVCVLLALFMSMLRELLHVGLAIQKVFVLLLGSYVVLFSEQFLHTVWRSMFGDISIKYYCSPVRE